MKRGVTVPVGTEIVIGALKLRKTADGWDDFSTYSRQGSMPEDIAKARKIADDAFAWLLKAYGSGED